MLRPLLTITSAHTAGGTALSCVSHTALPCAHFVLLPSLSPSSLHGCSTQLLSLPPAFVMLSS